MNSSTYSVEDGWGGYDDDDEGDGGDGGDGGGDGGGGDGGEGGEGDVEDTLFNTSDLSSWWHQNIILYSNLNLTPQELCPIWQPTLSTTDNTEDSVSGNARQVMVKMFLANSNFDSNPGFFKISHQIHFWS